jgi:hypothetical protein
MPPTIPPRIPPSPGQDARDEPRHNRNLVEAAHFLGSENRHDHRQRSDEDVKDVSEPGNPRDLRERQSSGP